MSFEIKKESDYVVIYLKEAIHIYNSDKVKREITQIIEQNSSLNFAISLAETPYLDSSGMVALAKIQKVARAQSSKIYFIEVSPNIQIALDLAGLKDQFEIIETFEKLPK